MNERIRKIYDRLLKKDYKNLRCDKEISVAEEYAARNVDLRMRAALRLKRMAEEERAVLFPEDRIGMMRTVTRVPSMLTNAEFETLRSAYFLFDDGQVNNISSDYGKILSAGFEERRQEIARRMSDLPGGDDRRTLYEAMLISVDALYTLADKYRVRAVELGIEDLAEALTVVPRRPPESYYQALVMMRLMNYTLWLNANKHNTLGRFDVYMYPYYAKDITEGRLSHDEALNLTKEFFIDLNFDADLYPGVQQGDNGQSMVLGGCDENGCPVFNDLSELCLRASLELKLIDPKINLRVDKNTPERQYVLGTELTKQGLGFPQYSNDDVVIPALVDWGYDLKDARNYVVAACWEFIIPGVAMDIVNIDALNFPAVVSEAIARSLKEPSAGFDGLMKAAREGIFRETAAMIARTERLFMQPSPFQSILMTDCIERGRDISEGAKYNNYGFHGAGVSNAADSLSAVRRCVFEQKTVAPETLLAAMKADFEGYEDIRNLLLAAPKMGDNDDRADELAVTLLDDFADSLSGKRNERGGIFRAGTGSAMYYIWFSENLGATADGRRAGTPFPANFSPSLDVRFDGVLSVVKSFTKPHLTRVCNGGPLTLEFHDTVFKNEEGTRKVAKLVELFIRQGGHQLQLNAVNRERLLAAQAHPEDYPNLIVRVWGWSGYFCELDTAYQNQILRRLEFVC